MITSKHTFGTAFVCRGHYRSASQGAPFHHGVGQIPISPFVTQETGRDTRLIAKISMILKRIEYYLARIISHRRSTNVIQFTFITLKWEKKPVLPCQSRRILRSAIWVLLKSDGLIAYIFAYWYPTHTGKAPGLSGEPTGTLTGIGSVNNTAEVIAAAGGGKLPGPSVLKKTSAFAQPPTHRWVTTQM